VLEPLSGYLLLAQRMTADGPAFSEGWNFGPGDAGTMDVESVVKHVIAAWGAGRYIIEPDADFHEAHLLKLDTSKARALLKWTTKMDVISAIEKSVEVYKLFGQDSESLECAINGQIDSYSAG
ncbi:MAG: CDP-glucose 4,6-dehydratase, partial [Clostridia bacterium]